MKRGTFRMLGTVVVFGLAAEAAPHLATAQCVGTAKEIRFCGPGERMLDRRLDHTPENEYDTFGGWAGTYVPSGAVISSSSANTPTFRYNPAGEMFIGGIR